MFIRKRHSQRTSTLFKLTDGFQSTKKDLIEVLNIVKNTGYPHTLTMLSTDHYNLVVFCPNDVLEFDLRK